MGKNSNQPREATATLVRGRYVLTSAEPAVVVDGAVRVAGATIDRVGEFAELRALFPEDSVLGGPHDVVTPGFVNTHGHFSEALISGIAEGRSLLEWVGCLIAPVARHLDAEMAYIGTQLAGVQMLRTGVTTTNDMFVYDPSEQVAPVTPSVVAALDRLGLRGVVSFGGADSRGQSHELVLREHAALQEAATASRLSRFRVGICGLAGLSPELFARSVDLALIHGSHLHLHETREEVDAVRERVGLTPIGYCARMGLFAAPALGAHCVWVNSEDREVLAGNDVGVAHNPVANLALASGVAPVNQLRSLGIAVGIGVDGAASNDRQDFLEALKLAALLPRIRAEQGLPAREALSMATIEGARALGMEAEIGSLEAGKAADLVVFDGDSPALANLHDPFQAVVYAAGPREVRHVWVDGEPSVIDGEVVRVVPLEVTRLSRPLAARLVRKAGLAGLSALASQRPQR